jgi:hypothetical protein
LFSSRTQIIQLDTYLRDIDYRVDRPQSKALIKSFFDTGSSAEFVVEDDDDDDKSKGKKKADEIVEAVTDYQWLTDAIEENIGDKQDLVEYLKGYQEELVATVKNFPEDSDDEGPDPAARLTRDRLKLRLGAQGLLVSSWDPRNVQASSRSRDFPLMIMCAITEGLAVKRYRQVMLNMLPTVAALRTDLAEIITSYLNHNDELDDTADALHFKYCDGIPLDDSEEENLIPELKGVLEEWEKATLKEKDNVSIQRLIRSIENSEVARLGAKDDKGRHVAFEVHQALDHLVEVSSF